MKSTETKSQTLIIDVPLQADNIDERGNVLYLDQERLDRKKTGFKRHKNKSNGIGLYNYITAHITHLNDKRWPIARFLYKLVIKYAPWLKQGGVKANIYKRITNLMKYEPKLKSRQTQIKYELLGILENIVEDE